MATARPKLTYFDIRGRGEPIRLALTDLGVDYEADTIERSTWKDRKAAGIADGSLCFGQIPQFSDEDVCMVQMNAILRHLGRKHGAYGRSEADRSQVDMLLDAVEDGRAKYLELCYRERFAEDKVREFGERIVDASAGGSGFIANTERLLGRNPKDAAFLVAGEGPTVADYSCLDFIDNVLRIVPTALDAAPLLKAWYDRMMARDRIKAYVASDPSWRRVVNGNGLG